MQFRGSSNFALQRFCNTATHCGPSLVPRCLLAHVVHRGPGYNSKDAGFRAGSSDLYLASGGGRHSTAYEKYETY